MLPDTPFPLASFIKLFKEGICMSNIFSNHIVKSKWQLITSQDHDRSWPMDKLVQARHKVKLSCNPNRSADVSVGWHWHQTFCQKAQLAFFAVHLYPRSCFHVYCTWLIHCHMCCKWCLFSAIVILLISPLYAFNIACVEVTEQQAAKYISLQMEKPIFLWLWV